MNSNGNLARHDHSLVLLIDIQPKLSAAMPPDEASSMQRSAQILGRAASALQIPVIATAQYPKGLGPVDESILSVLPPGSSVLAKTIFSAAADPDVELAIAASRRPQIVIAGQEAHICVLQSALQLLSARYQVFVLIDGIAARSPTHKANACARMAQAGVVVTNVESVLFEWLRDAGHPDFKALSALIR